MLFHLGYSEFILPFRLTEFPVTRHSKSSSHVCSVNADSMKTKRQAQGLRKKVKNLCLNCSLCSPEGKAHRLQKETMNFKKDKVFFYIIPENVPFHEDDPFS